MIVLIVCGVASLYGGKASVASVCIWRIIGFASLTDWGVLASIMLKVKMLLITSYSHTKTGRGTKSLNTKLSLVANCVANWNPSRFCASTGFCVCLRYHQQRFKFEHD